MPVVRIVLVALLLPTIGMAQAESVPPSDDWASWLIGEWEGVSESAGVVSPMWQSFTPILDGRYIYTEIRVGEGAQAYRGVGVFQYHAARDSAFGNWFGIYNDTNDGWAKRVGEKVVWHISRPGRTVTRIRERIGHDEYVVHNYVVLADGSRTESVERMRRTTGSTGS